MDKFIKRSTYSCLLLFAIAASLSTAEAQKFKFSDLSYPYPVQYQEVGNGQQLAYVDKGEGPAVIFLHGLGSYIPAWKQTIPALQKNHRVIAVDLPGFGKSSKDAEEYRISFFAQTVAQLQDSLGISEAVWVGHSMGGQIAMRAALTYEQKISKLVLLAPAGFETFTEQEGQMMSSFVTPSSIKATPDSLVQQTFRAIFYQFPKSAQFMIDDRLVIRSAANFEGYARAYAGSVQAMLKDPVTNELSNINQPTLIVYGRQDALIPNRQMHPKLTTREVAMNGDQKIPNSKLEFVDKAGHFVHFERPQVVNETILNFLTTK